MDRVLIVILYILLALIMYIDINRKYIPNFLNFSIFGLAIFITGLENFESFFIGSACYSLPIILIYGYLSDLLKKEVFGFGDIKLIISLGGLIYNNKINLFLQVYIFYLLVFSLATIFILTLFLKNIFCKKKIKLKGRELAFAPYISLTAIIMYNYLKYLEFPLWILRKLLVWLKL